MLAAQVEIHVDAVQWPLWVRALIFGMPTVIAVIALAVVLLRERRKRPRP